MVVCDVLSDTWSATPFTWPMHRLKVMAVLFSGLEL